MKQQQQEFKLPQIVNFQTEKFTIRLNLEAKTSGSEILRIQLQRREFEDDTFLCEIDQNQVRTNNHLSFFQRPSNLFAEMIAVQKDIRVTDFGQITFYVSLGRKSKYLITLNTISRRENFEIQNSEKQLLTDVKNFGELYDKYAQKAIRILKKNVELKKLNEQIPIKRKYGYQLEFQKYLQNKQLRYCNDIKEGILRALKSEK